MKVNKPRVITLTLMAILALSVYDAVAHTLGDNSYHAHDYVDLQPTTQYERHTATIHLLRNECLCGNKSACVSYLKHVKRVGDSGNSYKRVTSLQWDKLNTNKGE